MPNYKIYTLKQNYIDNNGLSYFGKYSQNLLRIECFIEGVNIFINQETTCITCGLRLDKHDKNGVVAKAFKTPHDPTIYLSDAATVRLSNLIKESNVTANIPFLLGKPDWDI